MRNSRALHVVVPFVAICATSAIACGGPGAESPSGGKGPNAAHAPLDGDAPIPYTAEQIRAACPPGNSRIFRIESPGKPTIIRTTRFLSATAQDAEVEIANADEAGDEPMPRTRKRVRWEELRQHSAFPRNRTTITEETITTPAGTFPVTVYAVKGEGDQLKRFAFAKNLAGPPVMFTFDEGGTRILTGTLIAVETAPRYAALEDIDTAARSMPQVAAMSGVRSSFLPALSPDGKTVAFLSDRGDVPQVWTVGADGGEPKAITKFDDPVSVFLWSPDGAWLAVSVAPGGSMSAEIWLMHPDGSDARKITTDGKANNFLQLFSHDGKKLAYVSNLRDAKTVDAYVYDIASGSTQRVVDLQGIGEVNDISRDGKRMIITRVPARGNEDIYVVDIASGAEIHLTPHQGPCTAWGGFFAPDGRSVYFAANLERDRIALLRTAIQEKSAGRVEVVAARDDADLHSFRFDEAFASGVLNWNVAGRSELQLYNPKTRATAKIEPPPLDIISGLTFSRDGKRFTFYGAGATSPANVYVYTRDTKRLMRVTDSPHEGIDLAKLVRPELLRYAGKDGLPLTAWLYRAPQSKGPGPLVLSFHGGPEGQERPHFDVTYQALLGRGISVLAPNVRGSWGFGKKFVNLDNGALRKGAVADIAATLDDAIAKGIADPKRVGIYGGSYGGFMVMAGLTEYPDRFAAGADLYGIVNFETFFAKSEPWMSAVSRIEYGNPDTEREMLRSLSPIHKIDRVRAATLVMHGANDTNVPVVEAEQVVRALGTRNVPVEYVLFPDEGHGFIKPKNRVRETVAVVRWFEKYLK